MLLWMVGSELDTDSGLRTFSCGVADGWVELNRLLVRLTCESS